MSIDGMDNPPVQTNKRALLIKFGAIGDVVMVIPTAEALTREGYAVDWVCGAAVLPLLRCYPWINAIPCDDKALLQGSARQKFAAMLVIWKSLRGVRYEFCAILYYDRRYRVLSWLVNARSTISLSRLDRERTLLPGRNHADEYARIVLGALRLDADDEKQVSLTPCQPAALPSNPVERLGGRTRVTLVPGGAKNMLRDNPLRRWPLENYVSLARELIDADVEVLLIGGSDDGWVLPHFGSLSVTNLIGRLSLPQTVAVLASSDVVVTHDTGPLHLAGVTKAGIVAIFGPTDPHAFLPRRPGVRALWGGEGFACRPCYDGRDFATCSNNGCIQAVTLYAVKAAVLDMIGHRRHGEICKATITAV